MGYYARARRLHKAAQVLAREGFPSDKHGWQKLEGVGNYTAAALAAFLAAFLQGQSVVVIDTNIRRLYSRILAESDEKKLQEQAKISCPKKTGETTPRSSVVSAVKNTDLTDSPESRPARARRSLASGIHFLS